MGLMETGFSYGHQRRCGKFKKGWLLALCANNQLMIHTAALNATRICTGFVGVWLMVKKKDMANGAFVSIVISRFLQGGYVFSLEYLK